MTFTKPQLGAMLSEKSGLNEREAEDMVESFYEEISLALATGESVKLSGFGNFEKGRDVVDCYPSEKLKALTRVQG